MVFACVDYPCWGMSHFVTRVTILVMRQLFSSTLYVEDMQKLLTTHT